MRNYVTISILPLDQIHQVNCTSLFGAITFKSVLEQLVEFHPNLTLVTKRYPSRGDLLIEFAGIKNTDELSWVYFVEEKFVYESIDRCIVKPGNELTLDFCLRKIPIAV